MINRKINSNDHKGVGEPLVREIIKGYKDSIYTTHYLYI